jgi:hypothetical protein
MSTVTVAPTVELSNVPPRVRLDVTDSGTPNLFATTVMRLDPDGALRPVRTQDGAPLTLGTSGSNRVGLVYDYEAPYGAPVSYSTLESPSTVSNPVTVDESRVWLVHPGVPALSLPITVAEIGERKRSRACSTRWAAPLRWSSLTAAARRSPWSSRPDRWTTLDAIRRTALRRLPGAAEHARTGWGSGSRRPTSRSAT